MFLATTCTDAVRHARAVYVLYNQSRLILLIIMLAFAVEIALMVVSLVIVIPNQTFSPTCLAEKSPGIYIMYW